MMAVAVTTGSSFSAAKPTVLFEGEYEATVFPQIATAYDVTPDGQRFLMVKQIAQPESAPAQINVVLNWFEELRRLVPTN
jgi:hypothetical protein